MVAQHIANGMYGLILVEPEGGLPPVDREFYVMQGEIYTEAAFGQHGSQEFSVEKLLNERPEYFVFNGSVGALVEAASAAGQGRRDRAHLLRRRRSELHLVVPRHRRNLRQGLQSRRRAQRAAARASRPSPCRRAAPSSPSSSSTCRATTSWSITRCRGSSAAWSASCTSKAQPTRKSMTARSARRRTLKCGTSACARVRARPAR